MTAGGAAGSCPRCGARVEPGQEYCLECGLRLPGGGLAASVGSAWRRRVGERTPDWLWPVIAVLVVAAAMTGIAILISEGGSAGRPFFNAIPDTTTAATTEPTTTEAPITETETTEPTTTEEEPAPEPPPRREIVEWPPSQNGYTVVIASLPTRAIAIRKAREVLRSNLPEVGVLYSSEFSSLHPGYYVVFSGIYANQRGALEAAPRVEDLYPAAYIRQISR